jgi:hypothetical protein
VAKVGRGHLPGILVIWKAGIRYAPVQFFSDIFAFSSILAQRLRSMDKGSR